MNYKEGENWVEQVKRKREEKQISHVRTVGVECSVEMLEKHSSAASCLN